MKVHISLNVSNLSKSVEFYRNMFGTEPAKMISAAGDEKESKTGYAKFDIAKPPLNLALNERPAAAAGGTLSHLGLQVETTDEVLNFKKLWSEAGLVTADEMDVTCCYARQDKTWVSDPDGNEWEAFVVLENVEKMNENESACCDGDFGVSASASKTLKADETVPAAAGCAVDAGATQGCC